MRGWRLPMIAPNPVTEPREFLTALYRAAVQRALPLHSMAPFLPPPPRGRTLVLGAGKAGGAMAQALEALWPADAPMSGLVVTRYHHVPPRPPGLVQRIEVVEAAHPVPDAAGLAAAERMLALTQGLTADDLVLCLISGGGSALLTLPAEGLSLADKQAINRALLASGANIAEMNNVRKHLSRIKGGRLAQACWPARVVTLSISDVPGDDPSTIASGPTVPDTSTCAEALATLARHRIALPPAVAQALRQRHPGDAQTWRPAVCRPRGAPDRRPQQSLQAAAELAQAAGLAAHILSDEMEGESREAGKVHAALARAVARRGQPFARPCVILSGGETTVTIRPRPPVPRAAAVAAPASFVWGWRRPCRGQPGVYGLAADTDGIDGVEDNAGAWVAPDTLHRAAHAGLKLEDHLDRHDAYGYFAALGDLVVTGPTFTNVNDFRAILVL